MRGQRHPAAPRVGRSERPAGPAAARGGGFDRLPPSYRFGMLRLPASAFDPMGRFGFGAGSGFDPASVFGVALSIARPDSGRPPSSVWVLLRVADSEETPLPAEDRLDRLGDGVRGDCEADAGAAGLGAGDAGRVACDLRVDTYHFTLFVEEWSTRVARVEGGSVWITLRSWRRRVRIFRAPAPTRCPL